MSNIRLSYRKLTVARQGSNPVAATCCPVVYGQQEFPTNAEVSFFDQISDGMESLDFGENGSGVTRPASEQAAQISRHRTSRQCLVLREFVVPSADRNSPRRIGALPRWVEKEDYIPVAHR